MLLGLTSLFTDVSSEMVASVLPLYLTLSLGLSPLRFGLIDGLYHGVTALVRVVGGLLADRWQRHKEVAAAGYGLSAACKLGLLAVGGAWSAIAAVVALDRTGKGVRTAPRDALISLSVPQAALAGAFGVHRAFDTAGAMLGPLVAFGMLALVPGAFDAVFVASFCAAMLGLGVLVSFVENRPAAGADHGPGAAVSLRAAAGLLGARRFRALLLAGTVLTLATVSDGFVYLSFQRRMSLGVGFFPLLYVATAFIYLVLAVPVGRLADRLGRAKVFLCGHLLLLGVYAALLLPTVGLVELTVSLVLFGAYYAATDGVLMALASAVVPPDLRGSGLALVTTATAVSRLLASLLFGALWMWWGPDRAVTGYLAGLVAAVGLAAALLVWRSQESPA